ncbi:hypothetical protein C8R43DRAFT_953795 [Mycena crocata]|nr:hypothetical protein C8R43DRAFT_953795 [Mycena crocata]
MQFSLSKLFAFVSAAQAIGMAAAVNVGTGVVSLRQTLQQFELVPRRTGPATFNGGIACINNNLGGTCGSLNLNAIPSVCVNLTPQFNDNISSFRINSGVRCVFYKDGACTGSSRSFTGTTNDLAGDALQDNISAYQCFRTIRKAGKGRGFANAIF